ncbi:hypothetical protein Hanom_Chr00s212270g01840931 [Helianthus anomalus]
MHYFKSKFKNFQQQTLCRSAQSSQIATTTGTLLISTLLISTISTNNRHFVNQHFVNRHNLRQQHALC